MLVPEIALTPQLVARFAERFGAPLAVLHSGLNDQRALHAWRAARSGEAPRRDRHALGGVRAAARPGLIVVDEEHDASYKQQDGFRYHARDLALVRAQRLAMPVVLGSATPSLESLSAPRRTRDAARAAGARGRRRPPAVSLVDLRKHAATQGIATPTRAQRIQRHLDAGGQVLLFLNRRGYAPMLFCPDCGWIAHCPRCDARLTVHQRDQRAALPSLRLASSRPGGLPDVRAGRRSRSARAPSASRRRCGSCSPTCRSRASTATPCAARARSRTRSPAITAGEVRLLVGTQMLAKGHDFPERHAGRRAERRPGLFGADFRAGERLAQTIVQVAGRAGRAERPGEVLIQTEYPEHPLLRAARDGRLRRVRRGGTRRARAAGWPPYARLAMLRAEAARRDPPHAFLERGSGLRGSDNDRDVEMLGPAGAPMERRGGHYRAQLLAHAASHAPLQRLLAGWLPAIEALPEARKGALVDRRRSARAVLRSQSSQ